MELAGSKVLVMGLGRHGGGVGAVRYLARQGACVSVADRASATELAASLAALDGIKGLTLRLGKDVACIDLAADLVVVNPAVTPRDPRLAWFEARGVPTTTEIDLFLDACPARVIGVTGSAGKSTTAAMISAALTASGRAAWLGGNFGGSLLESVDAMRPDDWVVLELSSFQLSRLAARAACFDAGVVTNCTPNHLDWHGDFAHYASAKRRLLSLVRADGVAVLDSADPVSWSWRGDTAGHVVDAAAECPKWQALILPGRHNRTNAALAGKVVRELGCDERAAEVAIRTFPGLPHRLQFVGEIAGRRFYDDSKATTPEATASAVETIANERPVWVLAGGADKGVALDAAADAIARRAAGAAIFGASRERLAASIRARSSPSSLHICETLAEALDWCWRSSRAGEAIVLSPGCASFDQFRDYVHRAEAYRELIVALSGSTKSCQARAPAVESRCHAGAARGVA